MIEPNSKLSFLLVRSFYLGLIWISLSISIGGVEGLSSSNNNCASRRHILQEGFAVGVAVIGSFTPPSALAAPPIAIIAEELGYFPVTLPDGDLRYVPKRVQRTSSRQSIELAKQLKDKDVTMYGTYWCPHCSRQKELFGIEAWSLINYVECSPKGYNFKGEKMCQNIDGYPSFEFKDKGGRKVNFSGERDLEYIAQQINFQFDSSLEEELPPGVGSTCKLR
mmetsp:Transcript_40023/g.40548  ORF Transcript_40023/g.40548 Transcript_40023/m.40548 type:complete len:222 (-) Transcript_40023:1004-1669(-)